MVLAVDLDALTMHDSAATQQLTNRLRDRPRTRLVYAAPDRSMYGAKLSLQFLQMPPGDVLVADGGATVHARDEHPDIEKLDKQLRRRWPGTYEVRTRMAPLSDILDERRWDDARRVRYLPRNVPVEDARDVVQDRLADLAVDVRVADHHHIDVVPTGATVATTLMQALDALEVDPRWVVAAGGFIGPRLFAEGGYWGIATGDTPRAVRGAVVHYRRVHITTETGARGVLDGLHALGFL